MSESIIIVEDEMAVRARLAGIVEKSEKYRVVAAFHACEPALDFLRENRVWLTILDLGLPGIAHTEAVRCIREADPKMEILVHTVFDADQHVFSALQHGATGYLIKDDRPESIIAALDELAAGGAPMSFAIARKVMEFFRGFKPPPEKTPAQLEPLTAREREVLQLLYEGFKYQSIADKLGVSRHTVHDHIKHIYQKLEVHSRAELMHKTIQGNLLPT
ncbi:MAG: response regulator transcription factor [Turneriella sp.]|nr:response regulator transcription factor [Turneriella sp.]